MAASETALFSLVRMERTREELSGGLRKAVERLLRRPLESLVTIIGLNEICNVFADCLATSFLLHAVGAWGGYVAALVAAKACSIKTRIDVEGNNVDRRHKRANFPMTCTRPGLAPSTLPSPWGTTSSASAGIRHTPIT